MSNVRSAQRDADILLALVDSSDEPEQGLDLLQLSSDQTTSSLQVGVVCVASATEAVNLSTFLQVRNCFAWVAKQCTALQEL